jgi:hypothetical protein
LRQLLAGKVKHLHLRRLLEHEILWTFPKLCHLRIEINTLQEKGPSDLARFLHRYCSPTVPAHATLYDRLSSSQPKADS